MTKQPAKIYLSHKGDQVDDNRVDLIGTDKAYHREDIVDGILRVLRSAPSPIDGVDAYAKWYANKDIQLSRIMKEID